MEKTVKIAGESVRLYYSVNALCAVEELAGGSLDNLMEKQFTATRLLLWGALREARPDITLQEAGELIGRHLLAGGSLEEIVNDCADALSDAGFFGRAAMETANAEA